MGSEAAAELQQGWGGAAWQGILILGHCSVNLRPMTDGTNICNMRT